MQSITKAWPENTVENKIKWAAMKNRPPEFKTLRGTVEEVKKFFANNKILSLPQIGEEISKLVDLLLCSGYRSWEEDEAEYAEETIKIIKNKDDEFPTYIFFKKRQSQYWVVENYLRKYAPLYAEELQKLSPTFNLAYLISYGAYAFHFRIGNCGEHAMLTLTLLLCGGRDYFPQNDIYAAYFVITKKDSNHAQVLLVRGKRFAEIIKSYFFQEKFRKKEEFLDLKIKSWRELIEFNWKVINNYEKAKQEKIEIKEKAAAYFYEWLSLIDSDDIEKIHRKLEDEEEENAYIADGFWGKAEHPRERIKNPDTLNFNATPLFRWGSTPDLKVLFSRILFDYKDFLLAS